jgi:hypothetical protein
MPASFFLPDIWKKLAGMARSYKGEGACGLSCLA